MFAIKRVFAAPPGKTSGFADLFSTFLARLKRRPPRHDQRSEQMQHKKVKVKNKHIDRNEQLEHYEYRTKQLAQ
jgi:hypothetical protein